MAQWSERSPPTNVARVQILVSTPYVGCVCCWFSPLLPEVFLRVLRFPFSSKTNFSKFQFDQESGRRKTTSSSSSKIWEVNKVYYVKYERGDCDLIIRKTILMLL